ncbi:putative lipid II flippase FtsW [Candidatus Gottesmanbacteria bacterium]|nr:putative lipid II flippase FtsW [Candidatus Gottesmanbacteria bacterium]
MSRRTAKSTNAPFDRWLLVIVVVLSLFGILMVYDASVAIAIRDFSNQYHFVKEQFLWLIIGSFVCAFCVLLDYHTWYKLALPLLVVTVGLLLAVFFPGIGVRALGAHRWINLGFFILQPAELAKFSIVVYLAAWFSAKEKGRFLAFLILVTMVFGLILIEPDMGTAAIVLIIALSLYFFSGAPLWHFAALMPILAVGLIGLAIVSPYRMQRLTSFVNREHDPLGASYQIRQVLLSLGSGGVFGLGLGQSRQKYEYLPEANTDAIFAIIGEELGFVGAISVMGLYVGLLWRGFRIAKEAPDRFGQILAAGATSWIGVQTILNLAAMVAILPLTGIPLPLISYGGSSLVSVLAGLGILLNVSKQRRP